MSSLLVYFCRTVEFLLYCYVTISLITKVWRSIRIYAEANLKQLKIINVYNDDQYPAESSSTLFVMGTQNTSGFIETGGKVAILTKQWEDNQMQAIQQQQNVIDISWNSEASEFENNNSNYLGWSQISTNSLRKDSNAASVSKKRNSPIPNKKLGADELSDDREENIDICLHRKRSTTVVSEIAKQFEKNEPKLKVHMASNAYNIAGSYFTNKNINVSDNCNGSHQKKENKFNGDEDINKKSSEETFTAEIAINKINNLKQCSDHETTSEIIVNHHVENQQEHQTSSSSSSSSSDENVIKNENSLKDINEALQRFQITSTTTATSTTIDNEEKQIIKENSFWSKHSQSQSSESTNEDDDEMMMLDDEVMEEKESQLNASTPTPQNNENVLISSLNNDEEVKLRMHSVHSVEEILNQQRFSRRLSAYSISEFLKDFPNENMDIDEIINEIIDENNLNAVKYVNSSQID